jgi:hypothetical protein
MPMRTGSMILKCYKKRSILGILALIEPKEGYFWIFWLKLLSSTRSTLKEMPMRAGSMILRDFD